MKKTITIGKETFTVKRHLEHRDAKAWDIYDAYDRPSRTKVNIWNYWNDWAKENGISYIKITGYCTSTFTIEGETPDGHWFKITRDNKYIEA